MEIKVDSEFKSLIPPISPNELKGLEESLLNEGCRDPLVTWDDILLDGHNRFEICQKHDVKFKTIDKGFDDRDQAKIWIICNQLGRRNLSPEQKTYLIGIQYKLEKKEVGQPKKELGQDEPITTAEKIAEQHHVSPATVKRAEKFAEAVDKLPEEEKAKVLAGKSPKTKAEIVNPIPKKEVKKEADREKERKLDRERMAPEFKEGFEVFFREIKNAKASKWKTTSKEAALKCIQILHDVTTIT